MSVLQSSLVVCSKWSEDWELILNPSKSEHLPVGDTSNPVTYSLISNAQPIQTVSSAHDLGLLLNTGFSAGGNVARATKKNVRGKLFYLKRSFVTLNTSIFLLLCKAFICPHLEYAIQASIILLRDCQALESAQKLALKFVIGLRRVPYEAALQRLRLVSLVRRRIRGDSIEDSLDQ